MKNPISVFALLVAAVQATNTLAVLEIIPKSEMEDVSIAEIRHLTDELRRQAVLTLPSEEPPGRPKEEYSSTLKKANDARELRDIGFIAGGVLLGAGIAVHIWF